VETQSKRSLTGDRIFDAIYSKKQAHEVLKNFGLLFGCKVKGKGHHCTGTEALYRPYSP